MVGVGVKVDGLMVIALLGIAAGVYLYVKKDAITTALDPTDSRNIVNSAVNNAVEAATGEKGQTLGGYVYDVLHPYDDPTRLWYEVW